MNHLAHLVLAGPEEGLRLGAFLGDHVKGQAALAELPESWAAGVRLHREVDRLCDQHPGVRSLVSEWGGPWRRYGPIVLDVLFDTMLTRHWSRLGPAPLPEFGQQVDDMLARHEEQLPARLVQFSRWARDHELWTRYDDPIMLQRIFDGIDRRHGRPSPLRQGLSRLEGWSDDIDALFVDVFETVHRETEHQRKRAASKVPP
ncbi:MAG: ACP phosphodiesterase [Pseudomonadota bacterium]